MDPRIGPIQGVQPKPKPIPTINFLNKSFGNFNIKYSNTLLFPFIVGVGFGFGWTPCIGPILGSILAFA
ncbi:MAG: cytochrome c biogenesis CcdA family protein, partial [Candidatus Fonsibacter sp.]